MFESILVNQPIWTQSNCFGRDSIEESENLGKKKKIDPWKCFESTYNNIKPESLNNLSKDLPDCVQRLSNRKVVTMTKNTIKRIFEVVSTSCIHMAQICLKYIRILQSIKISHKFYKYDGIKSFVYMKWD